MRANYHVHRSSSGHRIATATLPESECACVSIHVPAGGRDDPAGRAGTAHFVEHMIFKGTAARDARRISLETEDSGATLNAWTSEDQTVYEGRGDADCLPLLVEILADIVWSSVFPEDEIALERDVIAEEIVMYHEAPSDHIGDLISRALWSPHTLGEPITGTLDSLRAIDRSELLAFSRRHHAREDVVVAVAGPFEPAQVAALVEARLPRSTAAVATPAFAADRKPGIIREPRDTAQIQLALGYRGLHRSHPQRHALRLLATILGEGASSRLFHELREERGLCYHVSADASLLADTGTLEIHAGLDPAGRDEALEAIRFQLRALADRGPAKDELRRAKRLHASSMRSAMESTASHASWMGDSVLHHDEVIAPAAALEKIDAVTPAEIRDVAAGLFLPENEALAEIHPA